MESVFARFLLLAKKMLICLTMFYFHLKQLVLFNQLNFHPVVM